MGELVGAVAAFWHLNNNFIMHMENYWITGSLDAQHRISE